MGKIKRIGFRNRVCYLISPLFYSLGQIITFIYSPSLRNSMEEKPYVIINAAMTVDGKIASKSGDAEISCREDLIRVHELRKECDAILVGINTVLKDDPRLTVHKIKSNRQPLRVVIDSKLRIMEDARMFGEKGKTMIATTEKADKKKMEKLSKKESVELIICGKERVDLKKLMEILYSRGIRKLLVEGGGNIIFSFLKEKLADELRVAIAPYIVGGKHAITLAEGDGFEKIREGVKLKLKKYYALGEDFILEYEVL